MFFKYLKNNTKFNKNINKKSLLRFNIIGSRHLRLLVTDGTKCSCRLRVAFLSNPDAVVAGCELSCLHRNPN